MTPAVPTSPRLIEIIIAEVDGRARPAAAARVQCACHGVLHDCCPTRVRGVLDAGATRLGLHAGGGAPGEVAGLIDHTLLKPDATRAEIETLCREAARVPVRDRLREPDLGRDRRAACCTATRRRRLLGRRLSARRDDRRRQGLRDAPRRSSTAPARSTW